jgi:hypothetical protein
MIIDAFFMSILNEKNRNRFEFTFQDEEREFPEKNRVLLARTFTEFVD